MPQRFKLKNSVEAGKVPVADDLAPAELAVNLTDQKLYTKDANGNVVQLAGNDLKPYGPEESYLMIRDGEPKWIADGSEPKPPVYVSPVRLLDKRDEPAPPNATNFGCYNKDGFLIFPESSWDNYCRTLPTWIEPAPQASGLGGLAKTAGVLDIPFSLALQEGFESILEIDIAHRVTCPANQTNSFTSEVRASLQTDNENLEVIYNSFTASPPTTDHTWITTFQFFVRARNIGVVDFTLLVRAGYSTDYVTLQGAWVQRWRYVNADRHPVALVDKSTEGIPHESLSSFGVFSDDGFLVTPQMTWDEYCRGLSTFTVPAGQKTGLGGTPVLSASGHGQHNMRFPFSLNVYGGFEQMLEVVVSTAIYKYDASAGSSPHGYMYCTCDNEQVVEQQERFDERVSNDTPVWWTQTFKFYLTADSLGTLDFVYQVRAKTGTSVATIGAWVQSWRLVNVQDYPLQLIDARDKPIDPSMYDFGMYGSAGYPVLPPEPWDEYIRTLPTWTSPAATISGLGGIPISTGAQTDKPKFQFQLNIVGGFEEVLEIYTATHVKTASMTSAYTAHNYSMTTDNPNLTGITTTGSGNFLSVPGDEWFVRKFTFFVSGNNPGLCNFEFQVSCQYKELEVEAMFVQKYELVPAASYIKQRYIEEMVEAKMGELMTKYLPMAQTPCDGNLESPK